MQKHTIATPYMVGAVHVYTAELHGELVLFDTGPDTPEALEYLRTHIDLARLKHVFITHCHVDHYGLADFLCQHTEAQIYLPRKDAIKFRNHGRRLEHIHDLLLSYGFSEKFIREVRATVGNNGIFPSVPPRYQIVEESEMPRRLGISYLNCPGHSQSDLIYQVGDCCMSGDVLLQTIFQAPLLDVDLDTFSGRFRNYDAYCATIVKFRHLSGCRVLPGHGEEIESLDDTILFYIGKLLERAARIREFGHLRQISEVVGELFGDRPMNPFAIYIKVSEIIFMRDFLENPRQLRDALEVIGLFPRVSEQFAALAA
jgi:2,4-dienoyl-CoA reductase (NADPH2)